VCTGALLLVYFYSLISTYYSYLALYVSIITGSQGDCLDSVYLTNIDYDPLLNVLFFLENWLFMLAFVSAMNELFWIVFRMLPCLDYPAEFRLLWLSQVTFDTVHIFLLIYFLIPAEPGLLFPVALNSNECIFYCYVLFTNYGTTESDC
jgi:hypothetical protein